MSCNIFESREAFVRLRVNNYIATANLPRMHLLRNKTKWRLTFATTDRDRKRWIDIAVSKNEWLFVGVLS